MLEERDPTRMTSEATQEPQASENLSESNSAQHCPEPTSNHVFMSYIHTFLRVYFKSSCRFQPLLFVLKESLGVIALMTYGFILISGDQSGAEEADQTGSPEDPKNLEEDSAPSKNWDSNSNPSRPKIHSRKFRE